MNDMNDVPSILRRALPIPPLLGLFLVPAVLLRTPPPAGAAGTGWRPSVIWFVRHAETVANRSGEYTPETVNTFSKEGRLQVDRLTRELVAMNVHESFDEILVSPITRARRSIRPYLEQTGQVARIWPALAECCHQKDRSPPASPRIPRGHEIELDEDERAVFTLEGSPGRREYHPANYNDGMAQVRLLVEDLKARYAGSGRTVLLVGHALHGSRLIELLRGEEPAGRPRPENTRLWKLVEEPDGRYRLDVMNGRGLAPGPPAKAPVGRQETQTRSSQ